MLKIAITTWLLACLRALPLAAQPAAAVEPEGNLETHEGYRGIWIRSDQVEAFVALEPVFRVLSVRERGEPSLLRGADAASPEVGLRLAVMEPHQNADSGAPGDQPARLVEREGDRAVAELAPADTGLQYGVAAELAADEPRLDLRYELINRSDRPREVAIWSLWSFPREGQILVPFGTEPGSLRRLVLPTWAFWPQPGVAFGREVLRADLGGPLSGHVYKVGIVTEAGWGAYLRGGSAFVSRADYQAGEAYPEGGANITFFALERDGSGWAELEQVGPLVPIPPGGHSTLAEQVYLFEGPGDDQAPDEARRLIGEALGGYDLPSEAP